MTDNFSNVLAENKHLTHYCMLAAAHCMIKSRLDLTGISSSICKKDLF